MDKTQPDILCNGKGTDTGFAWGQLIERFWVGLARAYPGRVAVCFRRIGEMPQRLVDAGIHILEHDFHPGSAATVEFVRAGGYRHLYLSEQPNLSFGYAKLRRAGVRNIIVHSHYTPGDLFPAGVKRLAKTIVARTPLITANAYIAVSDIVHRQLTHQSCLPRAKCHIAENGIDLHAEHPVTDIRAELGLPADAVVVVSSSRIDAHKRVRHIVEAAAKTEGAYFVHCGKGPEMETVRKRIADLGLEKRFYLVGYRNDVPGILASANIAVHASAGEVGTSLAILEFQRAGLAIVLPDLENVTQSIIPGASALLYLSGDVDALAARLRLLIGNPQLRRQLGTAARAQVQRYDIRGTVARVSQIVGSVIGPADKASGAHRDA